MISLVTSNVCVVWFIRSHVYRILKIEYNQWTCLIYLWILLIIPQKKNVGFYFMPGKKILDRTVRIVPLASGFEKSNRVDYTPGMAEDVRSWVSSGSNAPVSALILFTVVVPACWKWSLMYPISKKRSIATTFLLFQNYGNK